MKSNKYWAQRSHLRMDAVQRQNDRVIGKVLEAYQDSQAEIDAEMQKILGTYAKNGKITMEEALQYLSNPDSKAYLDRLKKTISTIEDENLRQTMLNRINAPAYRARLTRFQAMKEKLYVETQKVADIEVRELQKGLVSTAAESYYRTMFDIQKRTGLGFDFSPISTRQIDEILKTNWSGAHFSKRIWSNADTMATELEYVLSKGIMSGKSIRKMSMEMADKFNVSQYKATRLIRTETTYVCNMAELEAYKEAGVKKLMFLATLDGRTSDICRKHDGSIVDVDKAVPGENIPPMHPNCRSTTLEVFEDDDLSQLKRRARDPETGETNLVPADMTYKKWYQQNVENNPEVQLNIKKAKNLTTDKEQYKRYKTILGKEMPVNGIDNFQNLKYNNFEEWKELKEYYDYKQKVPNANINQFRAKKDIEALGVKGKIRIPPDIIDTRGFSFDDNHINKERQHGITREEAEAFIREAKISITKWNGKYQNYYSYNGATYVDMENKEIRTSFHRNQYDELTEAILEVIKKYE